MILRPPRSTRTDTPFPYTTVVRSEGVPGRGKTLVVRALAQALGCDFARVQFTPDLMPSDVSGHAVYDPKTEGFVVRRGPVFTNLLLADEINRAPAKTQS